MPNGSFTANLKEFKGLTEKQAVKILREEGYNEIPADNKRTRLNIFWDIAREPMITLLLAGAAIYFALGEKQEALILFLMIFVVIGITFYQENKTERALEALRDLTSPRALVWRDGKQKRLSGREVVRGDLVIVSEGDRIPADANLLFSSNLTLDESLLTGESVPVRKESRADVTQTPSRPGGDGLPWVYSGTLVTTGRGLIRVYAVGIKTEAGKIGRALKSVTEDKTLVQKEVAKFVQSFAIFGFILCLGVVAAYGFIKNDWWHGLLAGIALAMSMLPEEFPVVLTIYLALGAWRIAQKNVLTRHIPAVEMLGATSVLCVDKTGTLTLNKMAVKKLLTDGEIYQVDFDSSNPLPADFHELTECAVLASHEDPFDPMEIAFDELGKKYLAQIDRRHSFGRWVKEYSLSNKLLATSHVWQKFEGGYLVATKGAPEAVAVLCDLDAEATAQLMAKVKKLAQDGLRVLAVAKAEHSGPEFPTDQSGFDFQYAGLIGLADPVRPTVRGSIKECRHAGIKVVMITGDYPETARQIACEIGLENCQEIITGAELEKMSEKELREKIKTASIFARIVPEQKMLLVNAFKANGEIVAMTGDGVNDAPALKAAHIGVAMGGRGTDVAREASDLVLLDDDFTSIVRAIRSGRRIFDNMREAVAFIISVHIPIAGVALLPVLFNWPLVLLPVHIVFLELIIDPACSLVFEAEPEESKIMDRPPRKIGDTLFNRRLLGFGLAQGFLVLISVLAVLMIAWYRGLSEEETRTLTFGSMVLAYLGLIITNISWNKKLKHIFVHKNTALWYVLVGAATFLLLTLYLPALRNLFHFSALGFFDLSIAVAVGLFNVLFFKLIKIVCKLQKAV